jgi:mono/diheme cytochrome c family protein
MGTSANPIGRIAIVSAIFVVAVMVVYYVFKPDQGQIAFGISLVAVVVAAFIYLVYARMNTVQRTGYMSLLFMILVAIMLPFFFLAQAKVNADRTQAQYLKTLAYGASLYTTYCATCHGLLGQGIGAPQLNNSLQYVAPGVSGADQLKNPGLEQLTQDDITRIITGGITDPTKGPTTYLMPQWGEQYGGPMNADDINALMLLITSGSPTLLQKYAQPTNLNGFTFVQNYLVNSPTLPNSYQNYQAQLAALSQPQGAPADFTTSKAVTIPVIDTPSSATSLYGFLVTDPVTGKPNNIVQIKVGTTVTWDNKSSALHSVTSGNSTTGDAHTWVSDDALAVGSTYQVTFTKTGTFPYYCKYHNGMVGVIIVVP